MSQTFGNPEVVSPPYLMRLTSPDGDTFYGQIPDHFQLSLAAPWESPAGMSGAIDKIAGNGTKTGKAVGAVSKVADLATGGVTQSRYMTKLQWQGKEYLRLDLPFHFYARKNADVEVTNAAKQLLMFAAPDDLQGALIAPAGGGIGQSGFILDMGKFARFEDLILLSVSVDWQMRMHRDTLHPMEAMINIQLSTAYVVTRQYLETSLLSSGPSATQSGLRSGAVNATAALSNLIRGK